MCRVALPARNTCRGDSVATILLPLCASCCSTCARRDTRHVVAFLLEHLHLLISGTLHYLFSFAIPIYYSLMLAQQQHF